MLGSLRAGDQQGDSVFNWTFQHCLVVQRHPLLKASQKDKEFITPPTGAGGNPKQSFPGRNYYHKTKSIDFCSLLLFTANLNEQNSSNWLNQRFLQDASNLSTSGSWRMPDSINLLWSGYQWGLEFLCALGFLLGSPIREMPPGHSG